MKKIYLLIGNLGHGGAERIVANLSVDFTQRGYDVKIIMFGSKSRIDYDYRGDLIYLDQAEEKTALSKVVLLVSRTLILAKLKRKDRDGIYISFLEYPNVLNILSGTKNNKTILSVRNYMSHKHEKGLKSFLWNWSIEKLYSKSDKIVAVSKAIKTDLVTKYDIEPNMIEVIYNGHNKEKILSRGSQEVPKIFTDILKENPNSKFMIHIGRFEPQKDHDNLLEIIKYIVTETPNVHLILLGEGKLKDEILLKAKSLSIHKNVHFEGFVKNPYAYLKNSDLMILTSKYEGFPNVLLEALFFGLPIVSTNCYSGPNEILTNDDIGRVSYGLKKALNLGYTGVLYPIFTQDSISNRRQAKIISQDVIKILKNPIIYESFKSKSIKKSNEFLEKNFSTSGINY